MRRFNVHLVTEVDFLEGDEASDQAARNYEKHLAEAIQMAALGVSSRTIRGARIESISVAELKDEL
jgi:hypothetical protein